MKIFRSIFFILLLLIVLVSSPCPPALAETNFSSAYDITYQINSSGIALVTQNIKLTNLTTNYYPKEYIITLNDSKIDNIQAWDNSGPLKYDLQNNVDLTKIHVFFNNIVVGQGNTLNWTLSYQTTQIAQKNGRIWEINIPRIADTDKPSTYNVALEIPHEFGQPAYIYPETDKQFSWSIPESTQGITMAFGDWQGYKFGLNYHLKNYSLIPKEETIALPPDTLYQDVIFENISPKPQYIFNDQDNNKLASFLLLPMQKIDIKVNGFAKIFINPRYEYFQFDNKQIYANYLKSLKYWDQTKEITTLARNLKQPEEIYNFVVDKLSYDYQRIGVSIDRLGATKALNTPDQAICTEFTDLFIALARAAGIPAREIDGYAYTNNIRLQPLSLSTDILHSWPEYWDNKKNIWIQVDPTWGKTSQLNYFHRFDFNHFAFVIKGLSSTNPYPAGAYKNDNLSKDILVNFTDSIPMIPSKLSIISFQKAQHNIFIFQLKLILILFAVIISILYLFYKIMH
ncbi:MAG: transglutaminase-like domain-containing protein [Candidatus Gottesmanbacteria bacterium]